MKFNEAAGHLANLEYRVYNLNDLTKVVQSVQNFKTSTLDRLNPPPSYSKNDPSLVDLKEIFVDCKYQRKMRLNHIVSKLKKEGGFVVEAAGHIDVALRPDGKMYVWDGFRRSLMASLVGVDKIPASVYVHPKNRSRKECEEYEAKMFKIRNADSEKMKPEEIFRSKIVYGDTDAMEFLDFLKECGVDVEGLNPGHCQLGGFVQTHTSWVSGWVSPESLIESSRIIQQTWEESPTISGYLLCGLALFLDVNEGIDNSYSIEEIEEYFADFVDTVPKRKQEVLIKNRISGMANQSVALTIADTVMGMRGSNLTKFANELELDKEQVSLIRGVI